MNGDVKAEFRNAVAVACESYRERPDSIFWEPHFVKVLNLIKANPGDKEFFIHQFVGFVENPKSELIPLIEFCMHELRWNEVAESAKARVDLVGRSLAKKWMSNIVNSFGDDWDGTLYYDYYSMQK